MEATTGSGKTLAFGIPIFDMLARRIDQHVSQLSTQDRDDEKKLVYFDKYDVGALVLAPTRELAVQIYEVLHLFSQQHTNLKCTLFIGGTSVADNSMDYLQNGGQVIIGTPGRVLDVAHRCKELCWKKLEVLVLDEADKLLDMGFKESINEILAMLPKQRRTGLFSATQTKEVKELARAGLRNPVTVSVKVQHAASLKASSGAAHSSSSSSAIAQATPSSLDNTYLIREYEDRPYEIIRFIETHRADKIIVFCATCACVDYYSKVFPHLLQSVSAGSADTKIPMVGFHGKMVTKKRSALYKKFKSLSSGVMFSTDVAARGIDIPDVDWIVQLAAPKDPAFFVHRVGRTARAGRKGGALLFITKEEEPYIELLRGRGVPLTLAKSSVDLTQTEDSHANQAVLQAMKNCAKVDREILEAGSTAFMSFIRAYKEHLCSYIFRLEHLDIGSLARSYGLLRLPKIAETRGVKGKPIVFETDPTDTATIPYHHKEKEQARLRKIQQRVKAEADANNGENSADDETAVKTKKSVNEKTKKAWVPAEEFERVDPKRERKRKKSHVTKFQEEWDELAAEETLFKKFKKGKISKNKYEDQLTSDRALTREDVDDNGSESSDLGESESD